MLDFYLEEEKAESRSMFQDIKAIIFVIKAKTYQ